MACGILDPWSGIEPPSPGLEAQRLSHWTPREVSQCYFLNVLIVMHPVLFRWIWLKECPVVQTPLLGFLLQVSFLWNPTGSPADRLFGGLCPWVTGSGRKKEGDEVTTRLTSTWGWNQGLSTWRQWTGPQGPWTLVLEYKKIECSFPTERIQGFH